MAKAIRITLFVSALFVSAPFLSAPAPWMPRDALAGEPALKPDPKGPAVYLVLMAGTPMVHVIRTPSVESCAEAGRYSNSARCVRVLPDGTTEELAHELDVLPASGPEDREQAKGGK